MFCHRPFLVGAGQLSDLEIRSASHALAAVWGGHLLEYSCKENPIEILASLSKEEEGLVSLLGDPGTYYLSRGSWLEALAAWRKPTILMASSSITGKLSGCASAYAALCESLAVPLVGIIQVGGDWDPVSRRLDGLPWCGWLPCDRQADVEDGGNCCHSEKMIATEIVLLLRRRIVKLNLPDRV